MKFKKYFQLALNILFHSKLRSWLTILGIVIGIGAVVAIVSISQGAEQTLKNRLSGLGADIITVSPGASRAGGSAFGGGPAEGREDSTVSTKQSKNLTASDVQAIKSVDNVKFVLSQVSARADVSYSSKSTTLNARGVDVSVWQYIATDTLSSGRFLTNGDTYSIVVGQNIASSMFGTELSLNNKLIIEGKSFKIVGILTEGSTIYMPIDTARVVLQDVGEDKLDSISVKLSDVSLVNETLAAITKKLMMSRGILNEKDKDFSVSSPTSMQQNMQQMLNTMTLFLGAIAAISLIVGAIGIANTMFTSVLEKTKEIGIMKSIGAKNIDILLIFLFNSGLIGLVGGLGGIILGAASSTMISSYSGISTSTRGGGGFMGNLFSSSLVTPQLVLLALAFSILIGMIAGAIPAYRASKLNPVDALRYE